VNRVLEIRVVGVGNPVLNSPIKRPLIVQSDVHVAISRSYLNPHRSWRRLRLSGSVAVGLLKVV
jgi:hypothetical protein